MPSSPNLSRLVISVDLQGADPIRGTTQQRRLQTLTKKLVKLFDRYRVPATWSVINPERCQLCDVVLAGAMEHEIALLGEPCWTCPETGRPQFVRELTRRVEGARCHGLSVSTLVLRNVQRCRHLDVLVRHGISMVRGGTPRQGWSPLTPPRILRHGVWSVQPSYWLPVRSRWPLASARARSVQRKIVGGLDAGQTIHLAVDVPALLEMNDAAVRLVERVLGSAEIRRRQSSIEILTLARLAENLLPSRRSTPARSVLRPAA